MFDELEALVLIADRDTAADLGDAYAIAEATIPAQGVADWDETAHRRPGDLRIWRKARMSYEVVVLAADVSKPGNCEVVIAGFGVLKAPTDYAHVVGVASDRIVA